MDAAAADYLALSLDGTDVLLMAADHALRRELSRRIRDDLIRLGIVAAGPAVRIADGATASAGDLIICTKNDHTVEAGEPGRTLANGDLLRIEAGHPGRADRPPGPGRRPGHRAAAVDRPHFPVPIFRRCRAGLRGHRPRRPGPHRDRRAGRDHRHRGPPARLRRPQPRHRHQPGLRVHRSHRSSPTRCRARGQHRSWPATTGSPPDTQGQPPAAAAETRDALAVLAGVLDRDGQQLSASQTRQQALADADHLAILHAIWTDQTTPAREQHYRDLLAGPACHPSTGASPATRPDGCGGPCAPPNWPAWTPARSWPLRSANGTWPEPATWPPSSTPASGTGPAPSSRPRRARGRPRSPPSPTPKRRAYLTEIAALMDARKDRIGEHAAQHALPWAVTALGPVPDDPLDRLDWQRRAASIGAWRELSGHTRPRRPDRPRACRGRPGPAGRLARGPGRPRPRRRTRRPRHARREAAAPARHLPDRDRLGAAIRRRRAPPGPRRRPRGPPGRPARRRRSRRRARAATTTPPPASRNSRPATTPCTRPTGSARPSSPPPWPTAPTGKPPPAPSATWPSPPTPNSAAATPTSTTRRSAPPNPNPPPTASAPNSPSPRSSRPAR